MLEVETMTTEDGLPDLLQLIEELYKHALDTVLQKNGDDVQLFHDNIAALEVKVIYIQVKYTKLIHTMGTLFFCKTTI